MKPYPTAVKASMRRPIKARDSRWAAALARWLARQGFHPNQVSVMSLAFSLFGGACLLVMPRLDPGWRLLLPVVVAACIGLRGLCNLLDGLMAVEGGLKTKSGDLFNELPDRFSDSVTLVCLGYSSCGDSLAPALGWAAAVLAAITAFVRVLGVQAGASAQFCGPMAKTARMGLVVAACLGLIVETALNLPARAAGLALGMVVIGCLVTIGRRTTRVIRELEVP